MHRPLAGHDSPVRSPVLSSGVPVFLTLHCKDTRGSHFEEGLRLALRLERPTPDAFINSGIPSAARIDAS
jgi:hypothetical protein